MEAGMPAAISFTVETDGTLPDGSTLREAVAAIVGCDLDLDDQLVAETRPTDRSAASARHCWAPAWDSCGLTLTPRKSLWVMLAHWH